MKLTLSEDDLARFVKENQIVDIEAEWDERGNKWGKRIFRRSDGKLFMLECCNNCPSHRPRKNKEGPKIYELQEVESVEVKTVVFRPVVDEEK